ncbi:hypothetical protein JTB14_025225 [Gonioctena quinquepunctata]|nr:hypothetical protein JTB14_025225 [Gonioctena quinquepunctata]
MPGPDRASRSLDRYKTLPNIDKMDYNELISYAQIAKTENSYLKTNNTESEKSYQGPHTRSRVNSIASNLTVHSANSSTQNPPRKSLDLSDTFRIKNLPQEIFEQRDAFRDKKW